MSDMEKTCGNCGDMVGENCGLCVKKSKWIPMNNGNKKKKYIGDSYILGEDMSEIDFNKLVDRFKKYRGDATCTCVDCPINHRCACSYDPYNTEGDCLLSK